MLRFLLVLVTLKRSMRFMRNISTRPTYQQMMLATPSQGNDLFAVNPLRRSACIVAGSWAMILGPVFFLEGNTQSLFLVAFGWIAATGIIMVTPILIWCLIEELVKVIRRRVHPTLDLLDLSPRAFNLLRRHGYETIASVEQTDDSTLLMLSNMDSRTLREIRRAISIWRYQRWQERGFPAEEMP